MSSIFSKMLMALTGLALVGFLILHLLGNLTLFGGAQVFNQYAAKLEDLGPLLIVAEVVLCAIFLTHVCLALKLTLTNRTARGPVAYVENKNQSTWASRMMWVTGILVLAFIVIHVKMFKFGERELPARPLVGNALGKDAAVLGASAAGTQGSLYGLVVKEFKQPGVAIFYVVLMLVLGVHLSHGIASAFQSLGLMRPGWMQCLKPWCVALAWMIVLGFALLPVCAILGIGIK